MGSLFNRSQCVGTTTVNTLIPDPDNAGLWFFRKTRTVQREPDQDPICLEFVDSDIVYSWKNCFSNGYGLQGDSID